MMQDPSHRADNSFRQPVGIYLHIPFCEKKCSYCDFYSIENHSQRSDFIVAITKEIELFGSMHGRLDADTIFFGGGTPSLLTPRELETILISLHKAFNITPNAEFTIECNPGVTDVAYLTEYRALGANRLSFGVQSFFEDELRFLSRIHNAQEAVTAVRRARDAGFTNINIDLIYALPGQKEERIPENLQRASSLGIEHISAYSLIVEPGTPLFAAVSRGDVVPTEDSRQARMYTSVMMLLRKHGYRQYEVSNYAKPGSECKHNLKYWNAQEYTAFGPSAHSYLHGERWWNVSSLSKYISEIREGRLPVSAKERLTFSQMLDEFVFLHLRQGKLDMRALLRKFSFRIDPDFVSELETSGYCEVNGDTLRLTTDGFRVCDEIARLLLSSSLHPV